MSVAAIWEVNWWLSELTLSRSLSLLPLSLSFSPSFYIIFKNNKTFFFKHSEAGIVGRGQGLHNIGQNIEHVFVLWELGGIQIKRVRFLIGVVKIQVNCLGYGLQLVQDDSHRQVASHLWNMVGAMRLQ